MRSSRIAFRRAAAPYDSIDSLPAQLPDTSRRPGPDPGAAINAAPIAPWTPALEPVLLATHALHALLSAALLRPATPPTPLAPSLCIDESPALAAHLRPTAILDARVGFWTPALEPALLATCALHALFLVARLRPTTPPTQVARFKGRNMELPVAK